MSNDDALDIAREWNGVRDTTPRQRTRLRMQPGIPIDRAGTKGLENGVGHMLGADHLHAIDDKPNEASGRQLAVHHYSRTTR